MAFCGKCGAQIEDGAKFCSVCGAEVISAEPRISLKDCEIFGSDCAFVISARRGVFDHTGGIHFEL